MSEQYTHVSIGGPGRAVLINKETGDLVALPIFKPCPKPNRKERRAAAKGKRLRRPHDRYAAVRRASHSLEPGVYTWAEVERAR